MADQADIAGDNIDAELAALVARSAQARPEAQFTGFCLFCEADLPHPRRWCDAQCCARWERQRDARGGT